ncbi:hypothetical protein AB0D59_06365 [Streptomyces sp. NPDC048417]|uniref:hypothetical protein n=1 Tax=Streptomyces sp. NPDC048417 TaxID=3155387 RepID=UPI00344307C7
MHVKQLFAAALIVGGGAAIATPAAAAEIHVSMDGAGYADTYYNRAVAQVCDSSTDNHSVAVQYYRSASSSTLRTIWVKTGSYTCNSSDTGSSILKARIEEQELTGADKYSAWVS